MQINICLKTLYVHYNSEIHAGVPEWHRELAKNQCSGGSSPLTRTNMGR